MLPKKYGVDNYYVGQLDLFEPCSFFLKKETLSLEDKKIIKFNNKTIDNGAIDLKKDAYFSYDEANRNFMYRELLTIFYENNSEYICLHNGTKYKFNTINCYKNLVPLKNLLPKIDYIPDDNLSIKQALNLFEIFFGNKKDYGTENLYNNIKHKTNDFFFANLTLCSGYEINKKGYESLNIPEINMLFRSSAKLGSLFGCCEKSQGTYGITKNNYDYLMFTCLFLETNGNLLNLNNNQIYNKKNDKNSEKNDENSEKNDEILKNKAQSYCEILTSLDKYIVVNKLNILKEEITVPEALKIFRKI